MIHTSPPPSTKGFEILYNSGLEVSHTGDTDPTSLLSIGIPGGKLKANGCVRIELSGTSNGNNDVKNITVMFDILTFDWIELPAHVSEQYWQYSIIIHNSNNEAIQSAHYKGWAGMADVATLYCGGVNEETIDTSESFGFGVFGQLDNAGDSIALRNATVEILSQS